MWSIPVRICTASTSLDHLNTKITISSPTKVAQHCERRIVQTDHRIAQICARATLWWSRRSANVPHATSTLSIGGPALVSIDSHLALPPSFLPEIYTTIQQKDYTWALRHKPVLLSNMFLSVQHHVNDNSSISSAKARTWGNPRWCSTKSRYVDTSGRRNLGVFDR